MKTLKELRAALAAKKKDGATALAEYNRLGAMTDRDETNEAAFAAADARVTALEGEVETLAASIADLEKQDRRRALFATTGLTIPNGARITSSGINPELTNGFSSLAEFARAVRSASTGMGTDERLAAAPSNVHMTAGNAGEGYLVPQHFREAIWEMVFSGFDLLPLFNPEPTASNMVQMVKDEATPWGSVGIQAFWRSEGAVMTASKLSVQPASVPLHELLAFVGATDELLSDAPLLQNRLTVKAAQAIRYRASQALYEGNGAGRPLGFMSSPALITQAAEGGQTAGTIVFNNLTKMVTRLHPSSFGNSIWMANSEVLPQLAALQIGNIPVFTPPNAGATQGIAGYILGRPLMYTEHNSALGAVGDICLIDPAGYYAVTKQGGGLDFASSIHLWFDQAITAFRWIFRIGGQPFLSAPVSPAKGGLTKSHFVTLAAR